MKSKAGFILVLSFFTAFAGCKGRLEQADPVREVTMSVRVFGPMTGDGAVDEQFCQEHLTQFSFTAVKADGPDDDVLPDQDIVTAPDEFLIFDPLFDQSDDDPPPPPVLVRSGGCFLDRDPVVMTTGEWTVTGQWNLPNGIEIWTASCTVFVSTDESTTSAPFLGFSANGAGLPGVSSMDGCVYDDLEGNRSYP